ncbi:MAG TPA: hypothetical protein PK864_10445 [Syntrophorhabdaceae bacterium]|nr:hypothetical protein [Syntrophorhabdaceae bacterium]HOL06492.1 hypothetical protein [Syntrophorhabdaceae bacterium]HON86424.1 hypothetical protein [Syntrophorhabdaceae bacterium]HOT42977.1 hypothetical protein [Syntrophorhabdaceae bacterium]HPC67645.1 hypothetical protein [Syntrophorhabdaceae bacterium]
MWNWKIIYEDDDIVCYLDIENIADSQADEDGFYSSVDCYRSLSERVAAWLMFFIKNKETVQRYKDYLKEKGVSLKAYKGYNNSLCLIELDAEKGLYRIIPALDYDDKGRELGVSRIITEEGKSFIKGIKGDWSPIKSRNTNKAIPSVFRFLYKTEQNSI